jgi:hypothetical protein
MLNSGVTIGREQDPDSDSDKNCVAGIDSKVTMPKTAEYSQK